MKYTTNGKTLDEMYRQGEADEREFIATIAPRYGLPLVIHPDKECDRTAVDLQTTCGRQDIDLKRHKTPFYKAGEYGLDPGQVVLVNVRQIQDYEFKYAQPLAMGLIFWVDWPTSRRFGVTVPAVSGVWSINLATLLERRERLPIFRVHSRLDTTGDPELLYLLQLCDIRRHQEWTPEKL